MQLLRLFGASFSLALRRDLAFRTNLMFELLMTATGLGAAVAALAVVFTQTPTLGGWSFADMVGLLGSYQIMSGLLATFIEPNLTWFANQVRDGKLDELLLKPAPSLFLATLGTCRPLALTQFILGVVFLLLGLSAGAYMPTAAQILGWILMLSIGLVLTWASRVCIAVIALWAPGLQLDVVYAALWQAGRYPVSIYQEPLRSLLSSVVPVAFVATFPTYTLMHGLQLPMLLSGLILSSLAVGGVSLLWSRGLRRYSSATS